MRSLLLAVVLSALLSAAVAITLSAPGTPTSSRSIKSVEDVLNPQPHVPLVKSPLPSADLGAFDETEEADAALTKEMEHYDDADFDPADAAALGEANTQPAAGENNKRKRLLIDGITYSGPGCPIGSVKISFPNSNKITPKFIAGRTDQLEFQLRFLRLSTGRTHRPPHSINCQIQVKLRQDGVSCPVRLWVDAVAYANLKQGMSGALTISSKSGSNWLLQQNAYDQKLYGPFRSRIDWQAHGSDAFSLPAPSSTFNIDLSASMAYQSLAPPAIKAENLYVQVRTLRGTVSFPDCKP